jgi:hypothetical protein
MTGSCCGGARPSSRKREEQATQSRPGRKAAEIRKDGSDRKAEGGASEGRSARPTRKRKPNPLSRTVRRNRSPPGKGTAKGFKRSFASLDGRMGSRRGSPRGPREGLSGACFGGDSKQGSCGRSNFCEDPNGRRGQAERRTLLLSRDPNEAARLREEPERETDDGASRPRDPEGNGRFTGTTHRDRPGPRGLGRNLGPPPGLALAGSLEPDRSLLRWPFLGPSSEACFGREVPAPRRSAEPEPSPAEETPENVGQWGPAATPAPISRPHPRAAAAAQ